MSDGHWPSRVHPERASIAKFVNTWLEARQLIITTTTATDRATRVTYHIVVGSLSSSHRGHRIHRGPCVGWPKVGALVHDPIAADHPSCPCLPYYLHCQAHRPKLMTAVRFGFDLIWFKVMAQWQGARWPVNELACPLCVRCTGIHT